MTIMNAIPDTWEKLTGRLRTFILSKVRDKNAAEDILQDVFVSAHSNIDSLREQSRFTSWIYQIARNLIADYYRNLKKEDKFAATLPLVDEENDDMHMMQEAISDMISMMDNLPPEYCDALCKTELEGMSQVKYAESLGIPYSTAKSRVQKSRQLLRDLLMKCCHYQFDKYGTVLNISPLACCCCQSE